MTMNINVRKANPDDIESMINLLGTLFSLEADFIADPSRQRRGLELMLANDQHRCVLVAECQSKVIGMCSAQILVSTSSGGYKALIEDVVVEKEYRGQGTGRQLLLSLERWAYGKAVKRLDLMADRNNINGLTFYNKLKWDRTNLVVLQKQNDAY